MKTIKDDSLIEWLTVQEVARTLRVSRDTIYTLLRGQELPAIQIGGQWRINREQFESWLKKKVILAAVPPNT